MEYYKYVTPLETSQAEPLSEQIQLIPQTTPLLIPRTKKTSPDQTTDGMPSSRRDQDARGPTPNRMHHRQGQTEVKLPITPKVTKPLTFTIIESVTHMITPTISPSCLVRTTSEVSELSGPNNRGRISTLSSMVRPTLTTATRTVARTREGGRDDAIKTVRRLLGPTSSSTAMTTPNTTINIPRMDLTVSTSTVQLTHTITETRLSSPPTMSRVTRTTAPMGTATPVSQDLIWPGHPDTQGTSLFPQDDDPATVAAGGLDTEERWKIHHQYDIPGIRRPTMETPDNLRRLTECEALVESLQTMEYLTEFPTLEER